ncbi:hypothetical protein KJ863_03700 [Patescibacteria group bacterium]|nr:hypothetical protein [Candidatus Falkowbacteria bacterium]MBU4073193.1 hypothetical protein [Patescibacteria group bacterium]MBU4125857.1 hypothetical protein [Patescibacteria group bacterium]
MAIIKNILLSAASTTILIGSAIFYIKIYLNAKEINVINKKIEEGYTRLDENEINDIKEIHEINIDFNGDKRKYKTSLKQEIKKWQREKNYLLEEISIYKIFKK